MIYKSAILGCGPRAEIHMQAYKGLDEIRLGALCDMNRERLDACGDKYGINRRYADLQEMLKREKPDILHIVISHNKRQFKLIGFICSCKCK